jgi:ceramide synthetase
MNFSIWNEQFWLPKNTTWKDFYQLEQNGIRVPRIHDLLYVYPLAGILYLARLLFEYYIAQPLGRSIRIRDYQSYIQRIIDQNVNKSKSSDKNRQQQRFTRVSPLAKFSESTWRFTFYLSIFLYGVIILKNVRLTKKKSQSI